VGHYKMRGELVALSPEDFAAWLARSSDEAKRAFDPDDAAAHWAWPWKAHP
jgi:cytochrome c oxidase subunit 2